MSDEFDLDKLTSAMNAATPAHDAEKRDANIALATANFEKLHASRQGSAPDARPNPEAARKPGLISGVREMFKKLTTKGVLAATTSIATLGVAMIVVLPTMYKTDPGGLRVAESTALVEVAAEAEPLGIVATEGIALADDAVQPSVQAQELFQGSPLSFAPPQARRGLATHDAIAPGVPQPDIMPLPESNTETFANEAPNPLKITTEEPVSTFSIDVDTASYAIVRSSLMQGYLPPAEAVRAEEMINYFPYDYTQPLDDQPFATTVTVTDTPWNAGTQLVHIGIQGELPLVAERPPLNLVFLIDTSGSMSSPDKLPLLVQSFRLMLSELRAEDSVAIVTYAGSAGQVLEPTPASETATIMNALTNLDAGGSTAGQAGLQQAYQVAEGMMEDGEISRVILATDGDFNVGLSDPDALKTYIADKRESGTYLSVLGFGRGNLNDATMQALAQNGNGTASYIDTLQEAQKVLVDQLSGALFPIANDVKIQMEFNPAEIAEYRLIGYETRALRREDFNNDAVDAGEIGAGHRVTAIYEVTPVGSDAVLNEPLRYASDELAEGNGELGFLRLRYKNPGEDISNLIETPVLTSVSETGAEAGFAIAMAGFAQLLQGSDYLGDWGYDQAIDLANANRGADEFGYRSDAVRLMRLAQSLSQ
ncbi:vWA domain-containing protein [Halocynthiibacter styelae]|uniref:VWA domain-containing protein n=1 Tax=Halocynthiibacter styelae TaxID=2761955 RepID=A0A8J7IS80_9RHOB|nr:VWA domain-containing protein [Paenihalocynthiibacter styelae]MBI1494586.1 VWA domain-containing protein [Paenihalocynthiibacter styelae]